jgi:hypothetical protein
LGLQQSAALGLVEWTDRSGEYGPRPFHHSGDRLFFELPYKFLDKGFSEFVNEIKHGGEFTTAFVSHLA